MAAIGLPCSRRLARSWRLPATAGLAASLYRRTATARDARRLARRFLRFEDMILRFATHPDLDIFSNNEAERTIRPAKVQQRSSGGCRRTLTGLAEFALADDPRQIVARLVSAVLGGSYLAISHPAADIHPDGMAKGAALMKWSMAGSITFRPREQVAAMFGDLELIEPGLVSTTQWRPDPGASTRPLPGWAGVARVP
jgi:S-adenosyl methyltransferase/Transposase IS66 family